MYLIFDTETTGLPKKWDAPITDLKNWPRVIQIAWQLHDEWGELMEQRDFIIRPDDFDIPYDSEKVHGISTALAHKKGIELDEALAHFNEAIEQCDFIVGQNVSFDIKVTGAEFLRREIESELTEKPVLDTCTEKTAQLCQLPGGKGGSFKLPNLSELHEHLFDEQFQEAHNASADVEATTRCFLELIRRRHYKTDELHQTADYLDLFQERNNTPFTLIGLEHIDLKAASKRIKKQQEQEIDQVRTTTVDEQFADDQQFVHLHNHSEFSRLQSTMSIDQLVEVAHQNDMPAVAMTDHGNMMGAFNFQVAADKVNAGVGEDEKPIKPIIGSEFNICEDRHDRSRKDIGHQMVLLAKNKNGYENLCKLSSISYVEGYYYEPRIDKDVLQEYKEDLIVLTGNLKGEIAAKILKEGEKQAREALEWWKEQFGDDLYIEIMRHGQEDEDRANEALIRLAREHAIDIVATNNTYYTYKENANAHDILLCVKNGEKQATPGGSGRGYRFKMPNDQYYFKSTAEMKALFTDIPEAITNTVKVADKIQPFELKRDILLPEFDIPDDFKTPNKTEIQIANDYLRKITYDGAEQRYEEITDTIRERLDFELDVIQRTGYPGYFLIVEDLIREARKMNVSVGPGRGSAAGSAVAYCLGITNIDPIAYNLLFERFLNPERISMPDIDIDFDDYGRSKVMQYVTDKYGADKVAQIITYGKMATKSAIKDTARVLDLPIPEAERLAKLVPDMMPKGYSLARFIDEGKKGLDKVLHKDQVEKVCQLIDIAHQGDEASEVLQQAKILEGNLRNIGVHACGVIITQDKMSDLVPVYMTKVNGTTTYLTQFDNNVVEDAGLLKMDFLGLKTLTLIQDTLKIIKARRDEDIDIEKLSLEDEKTYELFQRGETIGIFQYESEGMQSHLKSLKPNKFEDLIAMNALYRPGPMEYIPQFIKRKHGGEEIAFDLPEMEEHLAETYGITVYQEQVMLLSQKLADFTRGEADRLRKAMGKKKQAELDKLKPKFFENAKNNGHPEEKLEKIWKDWEAFAKYAFNKSHATCYAWVAYQTAYLKANYPAEFMASVLSNNMNDITKVSFYMDECRRMGLSVLGPDVNESFYEFSVNEQDAIRFGMGAIKNVGVHAVESIIKNRREKGAYKSIFDLAFRIDLKAANKKSFESLAYAGAFDCFPGIHRAQYFHIENGESHNFIEKVIKYANKKQEQSLSTQVSLFGEESSVQFPEPDVPNCPEWGNMRKLKAEKEVIGIYISGHPLNDYKHEVASICNADLKKVIHQPEKLKGKTIKIAGIVNNVEHRESQNGRGFAFFEIEDFNESYRFGIFKEEYMKYKHLLVQDEFLLLTIHLYTYYDKRNERESDIRFQFNNIELLDNSMDKYTGKLTLQLNAQEINETLLTDLEDIFQKNKGNKSLDFLIFDMAHQVKVRMSSRKKNINIDKQLLSNLEQMNLNYKVKQRV